MRSPRRKRPERTAMEVFVSCASCLGFMRTVERPSGEYDRVLSTQEDLKYRLYSNRSMISIVHVQDWSQTEIVLYEVCGVCTRSAELTAGNRMRERLEDHAEAHREQEEVTFEPDRPRDRGEFCNRCERYADTCTCARCVFCSNRFTYRYTATRPEVPMCNACSRVMNRMGTNPNNPVPVGLLRDPRITEIDHFEEAIRYLQVDVEEIINPMEDRSIFRSLTDAEEQHRAVRDQAELGLYLAFSPGRSDSTVRANVSDLVEQTRVLSMPIRDPLNQDGRQAFAELGPIRGLSQFNSRRAMARREEWLRVPDWNITPDGTGERPRRRPVRRTTVNPAVNVGDQIINNIYTQTDTGAGNHEQRGTYTATNFTWTTAMTNAATTMNTQLGVTEGVIEDLRADLDRLDRLTQRRREIE